MPVDLQAIVRRANWQANKRTLPAFRRVAAETLGKARALHGAGAYEAALDTVRSADGWQADSHAWRLVGLCYLGLNAHLRSIEAFEQARDLDAAELAKDEVNIATAHIAAHDYERALAAALHARELAPELVGPHVCLLAIHNRRERYDEVERTLADIMTKNSSVLAEREFLERVTNDTDLVGVADRIARMTGTKT